MARRAAALTVTRTPEYTVEILGRLFPCISMVRASDMVAHVRDRSSMGASEMGGQFPIREDGRIVGYVSYNGKVWLGQPGSHKSGTLVYDPYASEAEPPMSRIVHREPTCWAHTHTKDYTRPGELFVRCGWCDARRVQE